MLSKNKFCLQAVVAMQLCVCVCVWSCSGRGGCYGVWFVVKPRSAGPSRVQVGPAGPQWVTLPLRLVLRRALTVGARRGDEPTVHHRHHQPPTVGSGVGRMGDLVISVTPTSTCTCTSSPSSCFFPIFGPALEMKTPPRLFLPWFFVLLGTDKLTFELLGKENPAAQPILLPPEVAPTRGPRDWTITARLQLTV